MQLGVNHLITKAVEEQNYQVVSAVPTHLFNDIEQVYVKFIKDHFNRYGQMPDLEWFKQNNPAFRIDKTDQPLKLVFDIVSDVISERWIDQQLTDLVERNEKITAAKMVEIGNRAKIGSLELIDYNLFDRSQYFKTIKKIPTHIPWFDTNFGGLLGGDLVFIFGRMKSGKTLILQLLQRTLYKKSDGLKILAFSNELPSHQYIGKFDSMEVGFNPNIFRSLDFTDDIKDKLAKFNLTAKTHRNNIIIAGAANSADDVISTYMNMEVKPDVITIDGFELMGKLTGDASERSASMGANAYMIKRFAIENNLPIVGTLQGNRGAANTDAGTENVAGSDVFARACDILLTTREVTENGIPYIKITTAAYRYGPPATTHVKVNWDKMEFSFHDLIAGVVDIEDEETKLVEEFTEIKREQKEQEERQL